MTLEDSGSGVPVLVLPGIQGRWEWHRPTIDALARRCRVLTFSFADERRTGAPFKGPSCIDSYCSQVRDALAQAGLERAVLCGISYGGLVAAVFAARHPHLVSGLVLVSALPPGWRPDARVRMYLRAPWLLSPLFVMSSVRLFPEFLAASPHLSSAMWTATRHAWNALTHMFSPGRMARRAGEIAGAALEQEVATISTPTLVIVGERHLDRVVPVALTHQYLRLLPQAASTSLPNTGHLGSVTKPEQLADLVASFAERCGGFADNKETS